MFLEKFKKLIIILPWLCTLVPPPPVVWQTKLAGVSWKNPFAGETFLPGWNYEGRKLNYTTTVMKFCRYDPLEQLFVPTCQEVEKFSGKMYNLGVLFDILLFFEIISVLIGIPKHMCDMPLQSWSIKLSLEKILCIMTSCGTQITPQNENIMFFKGFPHGNYILRLANGCLPTNIDIFGAQTWLFQLLNDVSHIILAFLHMGLF